MTALRTEGSVDTGTEPGQLPIARLLIKCADQRGIVAAVSRCLAQSGANIIQSDQYSTDPQGGEFFMRLEFQITSEGLSALPDRFAPVADEFAMEYRFSHSGVRKRVALMVSRPDHCLLDLLWRWRRGELDCDIPLVVSNHEDLRGDVAMFGVRYVHIPVTRETKGAAERRLLEVLGREYDLVVLARYMQILSPEFLAEVATPIINIHHSFLPAFAGAEPYAQARQRGVKLIGATAHYVNEELDAGPIIEQDTARVTHRANAETLAQIGRDIERTVLARAVAWHLEDRVLVTGNRTVVFT
jgi:formyltetrahydrofolate deformylase